MSASYLISQQGEAWHRQGLYMGMHWAWWIFWIAAIAILVWAFWRLAADRRQAHERVRRILEAEDTLRQRFARGEIDESELAEGKRALRASRSR